MKLQCNKAMKQGETCPPPRTHQSLSEPPWTDLQIKDPAWSRLKRDKKLSQIQEYNDNKKMVNAQFVAESKAAGQVTKNLNVHTVYQISQQT